MISVVGDMFCSPDRVELVVKRRRMSLTSYHYAVFNLSDELIFTIDRGIWSNPRDYVLRDESTGDTLLSIRKGRPSASSKNSWIVYRGEESQESEDRLFSVMESSDLWAYLGNRVFDVHLCENQPITSADYTNRCFPTYGPGICSSFKLSGTTYYTDLYEVVRNVSWKELIRGRCSFKVRVSPYVDSAFVIALFAIIYG